MKGLPGFSAAQFSLPMGCFGSIVSGYAIELTALSQADSLPVLWSTNLL